MNAGQKSGRLSDLVSRFSRQISRSDVGTCPVVETRLVAAVSAEPVVSSKTLATFLSLVFSQPAAELVDLGPVIGPDITFLGERVGCKIHVGDLYADLDRHARQGALDRFPEFLGRRFALLDESVERGAVLGRLRLPCSGGGKRSRRRVDAGSAAGRRATPRDPLSEARRELTSRPWPTGFESVMPVRYPDAAAAFSFLFRRPVAPASPRGARSFFSAFFSVSFGVSARSTSSRNTMGAPSPGRGPALMIRV